MSESADEGGSHELGEISPQRSACLMLTAWSKWWSKCGQNPIPQNLVSNFFCFVHTASLLYRLPSLNILAQLK